MNHYFHDTVVFVAGVEITGTLNVGPFDLNRK